MPLLPGKENIGTNITELREHGSRHRSEKQILAIALSEADRHPHAALGGGIGSSLGRLPHIGIGASHSQVMSPSQSTPFWTRTAARQIDASPARGIGHFAAGGGLMSASEASPWTERADARIMDQPFHGGLIGGSGAGRTDQIPLAVGGDSHVMPADVVSGLGQGHTLAGARILDASLKTGPWGVPFPHEARGRGPPAPPHVSTAAENPAPTGIEKSMMSGLAEGGPTKKTSILAASGEYVVEPEVVEELGRRVIAEDPKKGNQSPMALGHEALDALIARVRKFNIEWLRHAPPPKKSMGGAIGLPLAA